jgi:hypothetical protein
MSQKRTDHSEELFALGWLIDAAVTKLNADPDDLEAWSVVRWALERLQQELQPTELETL